MNAARELSLTSDIHKTQVKLYNKIASMDDDSLLSNWCVNPAGMRQEYGIKGGRGGHLSKSGAHAYTT